MAAAGKKGKKKNWKQLDVEAFLPNSHPGLAKSASWADEVEDNEREHSSANSRKPNLPTAPRSVRGSEDINVPTSPPFVAYVTNIPFEITEDELADFFSGLKISTIRLPESEPGKLRGYGYVEFEDRTSLIEALQIPDTSLKGRRLRIELSENSNDRFGRMDRGRDRMGMGLGRDRDDDPERTSGDWRSKPRVEPPGDDRDRFRSSGRREFGDRDGRDSFGAPRELDSREGGWREGMGSAPPPSDRFGDRDRDRDSFRSRDGFGDRDRDRDSFRSRDGFGDRDRDRDRFGDRRGFGDRDRDSYDRPRFGDRDRDSFRDRRFDERDDDKERITRRDDGPSDSSEPKMRPRLQLQPRTRPVENPAPLPEEKPQDSTSAPAEPEKPPAAAPAPRASIFGAAKPVDTAAREREIEERLAKERERPERSERPRLEEREGGGEQVDESTSKKADQALPPKENAWARRPRIEPGADDGDGTRREDSRDRPSRDRDRDDDRRDDYRERRGYGYSRERREDVGYRENGDGRGSHRDSSRGGYRDEGEDRNGSRDRRDDNRGGSRDRRNDNRGGSRDRREDERAGSRDGGVDGRGGSRDRRDDGRAGDYARNRDDSGSSSVRYERESGRGRGGHHGRVERDSDRGRGRGGSKSRPPPDRPAVRDHSNEDQPRMPKYEEKQVPNFVGSNKYAFLDEAEDPDGASD